MSASGRGGVIRTRDPLLPKQMRYQAALRPETDANNGRLMPRKALRRNVSLYDQSRRCISLKTPDPRTTSRRPT